MKNSIAALLNFVLTIFTFANNNQFFMQIFEKNAKKQK